MKKTLSLVMLFFLTSVLAQVDKHIYKLNSLNNLLTEQVKKILDENLIKKRIVFLGEAEHHIGSDFIAKTELVKYLVSEKGYTEIVFESDFFGLFFEHNKDNIYHHWSRVKQCQELFNFLEKNKVTIWGFDNYTHSHYTRINFVPKLTEFLKRNTIKYDENFIKLIKIIMKNGSKSKKYLNKKEVEYLIAKLNKLLKNDKIIKDNLWYQILESFRSAVLIFTTESSKNKGIPIRDKQMAKNLNFIVNKLSNKKLIVWLANAHMGKYEYDFMKGETMGGQFVKQNPNISYHIAVSSIKMPYRKEKWLLKMSKNKNNLLHFLPSIDNNYFINSKQLILENPKFANTKYSGMFGLKKSNTNWFKHFDALIFISKGQKAVYYK